MKDKLDEPCRECPFRRTSLAGYLGRNDAKSFIERVDRQRPNECHMTVDYNDPQWKEKIDDAILCAGAATYLANTLSSPRDPEYQAAVDRLGPDHETVFSWTDEFLAHHDTPQNAYFAAKGTPQETEATEAYLQWQREQRAER